MRILLLVVFTMMHGMCAVVNAGVAGYEDTTNLGVYSKVKCAEGMNCSKSGQFLVLKTRLAAIQTFTSGDQTPSVANGNLFQSFAGNAVTITTFDDGSTGKEIVVMSKGAVTFDVTGTTLYCGSTDLATASGDITRWVKTSLDWRCTSFIDNSDNLN